ncbi:MAG: fibronectin type III domain-containing protein, partial [Actinomycetota bacterium]
SGENTVSAIKVSNNSVLGTWNVGNTPDSVVVSADSKTIYVSNSMDDTVSVLDALTGNELPGSPVAVGTQPLGLALSPDGSTVAVATSADNGSIWLIHTTDLSTTEITSDTWVRASLDSVAIDPAGTFGYATDAIGGGVATFSLGEHPQGIGYDIFGVGLLGIVVSSDGKTLYAVDSVNSTLNAAPILDNGQPDVSNPSNFPVGIGPTDVEVVPGTPYLEVVNGFDGNVMLFNTETSTVDKTIGIGNDADSVGVVPGSVTSYVSSPSDGSLAVVDSSVQPAIGVAVGNLPVDIAISPDATMAYVLNQDDGSISYLRLADNQVIKTAYVGYGPQSIVLSRDGSTIYVANNGDSSISVLSAATGKDLDSSPWQGIDSPYGMAVSPDGATLYVSNNGPGTITAYATASGAQIGDPWLIGDSDAPAGPTGIVLSPDGSTLYVANSQTDDVAAIPVANPSAAVSWATGSGPGAIAISPDGKTIYTSNQGDDSISAISTSTGMDSGPYALPAGSYPSGLEVINAGATLAVTLTGSDSLALFKRSTMSQEPVYADVGTSPSAVGGAGSSVFVVNMGDNNVSILSPPGAPSNVQAGLGRGGVSVSWTPSDLATGVPTARYLVTSVPGGQTCSANAPNLSCTVSGLTPGTSYVFTVVASSVLGSSAASDASAPVTMPFKPGAPTGLSLSPGIGNLQASWLAPSSNGGAEIQTYTVTAMPGNKTCIAQAPLLTCTISGLSATIIYSVSVIATNAAGNSNASNTATAIPLVARTAPLAPSVVSAVARSGGATLTWAVPQDGGSAITGYTASVYDESLSMVTQCVVTKNLCKVSGLVNGSSYSVTVIASNAIGDSAASSPVFFTPTGPPLAPTLVTLTAAPGQITASWAAALADAGNPVIAYQVTLSPGGATCFSASLSCSILGLSNGTSYTATVVATNASGDSPASQPSSSAVPADRPSKLDAPLITADTQSLTGYWSAPSSSNGSAVISYTLTANLAGSSSVAGSCTTVNLTCKVTGLTNGQSYTATVVATNAVGSSPASSASAAIIVAGKPSVVQNVQLRANSRSISVSWDAPADNGGSAVTGYLVSASTSESQVAAGTPCVGAATLRSCVVTGLTNGASYVISVTVTNRVGKATYLSTDATTPLDLPAAPLGIVLTPSHQAVNVRWNAPADNGGSEISSYTARAYLASNPGSSVASCSPSNGSLACDISGLTDGASYLVAVTATNSLGEGAASAPLPVTPFTLPGRPLNIIVQAASKSLKVSWQAPLS